MFYAAVGLAAAVPIALGLLVVWLGTPRRIGWLLMAHGVSIGLLLGGSTVGDGGRASLVTDQLTQGSWVLLFLWLVLIAYLLPDGRPASRFWQWWLRAGLAGTVLFVLGSAGDASEFRETHSGQEPPLTWLPPPVSDVLGVVGLVLVEVLFFGSVFAVRHRLKRSTGETRLQLLWLVWGALAVPVGLLVIWANHFVLGDHDWLTTAALTGVSVALPATITAAILRYRLFDIQVVLSRTLTYAVLLGAVAALYALLLLTAEQLSGTSTVGGLLAVTLVAVTFHPAHSWLRHRVERWVYGYRSQPDKALRLLADRADAAETADAETLAASITTVVAEALRVDHVWVDTGESADSERVVRTPLVHRGEQLGDLAVELPPGRHLAPADVSLLRDLARYAAVLVRSEQQAAQLRDSRSQIVAGREEERRRLRRDLHDGVGPSLAAIVLKLNAAQSRAGEAERNELLAETRAEVRDTIAEVRRLVDDLRPPAIDEIGLLGAIRQRAAALSGALAVEVIGPDVMPPLPAAVEVAAFRITAEALTNVVRHSAATRCRVGITVNGLFELTVTDNGRGTGRSTGGGVGWTSMRERAAELGGSCTISSRPGGGLVVRAVLPFDHTARAPAETGAGA